MKSNKNTFPARLAVFFLVILLSGLFVWFWWRDGLSPVNKSDSSSVEISINSGDSVKSIVNNLFKNNLIRSSTAFYILIKLQGFDRNLQAGVYRLSRQMDALTLARELTHGVIDAWVTVIEGWRIEEIATEIAKNLDIPESEFLKFAQEGFMFPDTYRISKEATAAAVVKIMNDNFDKKLTAQLRQDINKSGLSLNDVVILASLVEREGKTQSDRPIITGILLNRIKASWPLQVDATVQYALGYQSMSKTWWKKIITNEDKNIDSLYNTYKYPGLPPAPITNPGLSSITAVIYPAQTSYMYYLHDTSGNIHYAVTLEEHNQNIAKYLRN